MLKSAKGLMGYTIGAKDGELGSVHDFLFDDERWITRYLVVDTRQWLPGRKVLIAGSVLGAPSLADKVFPVALSKDQVRNSPVIDADKPISRRQEQLLVDYYQWVPYWGGGSVAPVVTEAETHRTEEAKKEGDPHLRSVREVTGYSIHATDGSVGHVGDFILEDTNWAIRSLVVDTRAWLPGRDVLISPKSIREIRWAERAVYVELTRDEVKNSHEYDPTAPVNSRFEERLYDYYGRPRQPAEA